MPTAEWAAMTGTQLALFQRREFTDAKQGRQTYPALCSDHAPGSSETAGVGRQGEGHGQELRNSTWILQHTLHSHPLPCG